MYQQVAVDATYTVETEMAMLVQEKDAQHPDIMLNSTKTSVAMAPTMKELMCSRVSFLIIFEAVAPRNSGASIFESSSI